MTTDLLSKISALPSNTDYASAATYAALMDDDGSIGDDDTPIEDTDAELNAGEQQAELQAEAQGETEAVAEEGAQAQADAKAEESSETPAVADQAEEPKVEGVLTKDGKHVLPFGVLEGTRKEVQTLRQQKEELRAQTERLAAELEAVKAGKKIEDEASKVLYTKEQIEEAKADFPVMAEMMARQNELVQQLSEVRKETAAVQAPIRRREEDDGAADVQALIDQRPLLAQWQAENSRLWQKAVELDNELRADDVWKDKSEAERFAAVEASIAARYGMKPATPPAQPAAQAKTPTPKPAAKQPEVKEVMPTLSDFGGRAAVTSKDEWAGLNDRQMHDKASRMSAEELRRWVGVNY